MKKLLLFGAGIQTTALAIMVAKGELQIDLAVFADTGGEKPETYWYMENYMLPLFKEAGIDFKIVRNELPNYQPDLYGFLWKIKDIPSVRQRRCSDHFKIRPIDRALGKEITKVIGFSFDEIYRAKRSRHKYVEFPLIERQMTANDCRYLIQQYGWPLPLKSSCFFCVFQHPTEWNWLKNNHPKLFDKALALEANYHDRKPHMRDSYGLLRGTPLRRLSSGLQPEMLIDTGESCWSGYCSH